MARLLWIKIRLGFPRETQQVGINTTADG